MYDIFNSKNKNKPLLLNIVFVLKNYLTIFFAEQRGTYNDISSVNETIAITRDVEAEP